MSSYAFVSAVGLGRVRAPSAVSTRTSCRSRVATLVRCARDSDTYDTKPLAVRLPKVMQPWSAGLTTVLASSLTFGPAAWATDGTGEPLGIDDSRLLVVLLGIFITILALFIGWSSKQDDQDDFVGEYDPRRR